jgi:phosphopantetheine--protein transferase-like protein
MKNELSKAAGLLNTGKKFAVGNDLVFVPAFERSLTDLFKSKVYTHNETVYCQLFDDPILRYASTWAAKEAVYKAVKQLTIKSLSWKNIEIIRAKIAGQPGVILHGFEGQFTISLTISHDGDYAWAVAFIEPL